MVKTIIIISISVLGYTPQKRIKVTEYHPLAFVYLGGVAPRKSNLLFGSRGGLSF